MEAARLLSKEEKEIFFFFFAFFAPLRLCVKIACQQSKPATERRNPLWLKTH
jgi:hypothetical protein